MKRIVGISALVAVLLVAGLVFSGHEEDFKPGFFPQAVAEYLHPLFPIQGVLLGMMPFGEVEYVHVGLLNESGPVGEAVHLATKDTMLGPLMLFRKPDGTVLFVHPDFAASGALRVFFPDLAHAS